MADSEDCGATRTGVPKSPPAESQTITGHHPSLSVILASAELTLTARIGAALDSFLLVVAHPIRFFSGLLRCRNDSTTTPT